MTADTNDTGRPGRQELIAALHRLRPTSQQKTKPDPVQWLCREAGIDGFRDAVLATVARWLATRNRHLSTNPHELRQLCRRAQSTHLALDYARFIEQLPPDAEPNHEFMSDSHCSIRRSTPAGKVISYSRLSTTTH